MNKLLIPPSANWYEADIMTCAPDNTLIYGARQDLIIIKPTLENEPDDVQVISRAHSMRIKSVNVNRNWGQPNKYAITVSEDKVIKLWDVESLTKKLSHNKHVSKDDSTKVVGASFAGDDRVISSSESGTVIIWNIIKNEATELNSLFDTKVTVTCLSVCPHATWLAAFGLKNGLIIVTDLRKSGKVLYKLRGHDKPVISLSWCPAPVNIFPVKPNNKVVEKSSEAGEERVNDERALEEAEHSNIIPKIDIQISAENEETEEGEESSETANGKSNRRKQKNPKKTNKEKTFLEECADVRKQILKMSTPKNDSGVEEASTTQKPDSVQKFAPRSKLKPKTKSQRYHLSELLLKKESLQGGTEAAQKDAAEDPQETENKAVDTPTDRREISMEISKSVEPLRIKLTDTDEKSMEITTCGRKESTNTIDSADSKVVHEEAPSYVEVRESSSDASILDITNSTDEIKKFTSVSSCDTDLNCSKKNEKVLEMEEVKKHDVSSASEPGDVFHDAQVCHPKGDIGCEIGGVEFANCEVSTPQSPATEQHRKEFLLASSAREPNIYIWRAGTDGRMQTLITVPPVKNQKKSRSDKLWITICWVAPQILLSSSRGADLLQWTLPKPMVQAKFVRTVHRDHWSVLFSIKAPISYLNEYNFLQKREINAWTTGMDRTILNTDIDSQKNLGCYPALGGSVNYFSGSPLDPNRLAIGTGEGVLHVWDLSREHTKRIVFSTFYQKISAPITALAWHPRIETSLALGTMEGRVGVLDTSGKTKTPKILTHYFKSEIFKLEWGPLNGDLNNLGLYVVSEAKLAIFDLKSKNKEPELLQLPNNVEVYTMSWKPDYSLLLVASKSGHLITYTSDLIFLQIYFLRHKLEYIVWHPNAASDDTSDAPNYSRTFVSIHKHNAFVVYDLCADFYNKNAIASFENRGVFINSIAWNPHVPSQLVFTDDGGVAQVYDIELGMILATYVSPSLDALLSVHWSPINPDYVIVGTVSHKIAIWSVCENGPLPEKEIHSRRNKITKEQKKTGDQSVKQKAPPSAETKTKKPGKFTILSTFYGIRETTATEDIKKLLQWKVGDQSVEPDVADSKNIDVMDVFSNKVSTGRILDLNISAFRKQGKHHNANLLTLFKGDVDTVVKEAIDQRRVNPWIISMCPMVAPKLWQTACETYAHQLQEEPEADPLEIVTYLLACHKVEESIEVLCEKAMYREALILAKARFGEDSSVIPEILDQWGRNSLLHGNLELAAECYIAIGKFAEAAGALFRRNNIELLELAVELAKLSGQKELEEAVLFRLTAFKAEVQQPQGYFLHHTWEGEEEQVLPPSDSLEPLEAQPSNCKWKDFSKELHVDIPYDHGTLWNWLGSQHSQPYAQSSDSDEAWKAWRPSNGRDEELKEVSSEFPAGNVKEFDEAARRKELEIASIMFKNSGKEWMKDELGDKTDVNGAQSVEDKSRELKGKEPSKSGFETDGLKLLDGLKVSSDDKEDKVDDKTDKTQQIMSQEEFFKKLNAILSSEETQRAYYEAKEALKSPERPKVSDEEKQDKADDNAVAYNEFLEAESESATIEEIDDQELVQKINELFELLDSSTEEQEALKFRKELKISDEEKQTEADDKTDVNKPLLEQKPESATEEIISEKELLEEETEVKVKEVKGKKEFSEKGNKHLPDSLKEERECELNEVAREALKSLEGVLSTVEDSMKQFPNAKRSEKLDKELEEEAVQEKALETKSEVANKGPKGEEKQDDRTDLKNRSLIPEKTEMKLEDCDKEFSKKVNESLPDSLKEENELEGAQKILKSQEGLLSTDEVKELLLKRKVNLEGNSCVKEDGAE